jgi:outer membrane protein insertion porin family/translocation and assembly module TamA
VTWPSADRASPDPRVSAALTRLAYLALLAALVAAGAACSTLQPGQYAIDTVTVRGADKVSADDVLDKLATEDSPKMLGLFRGFLYDYVVFNRATLQRDLARVERYYRARGFYEAHARAGRVLTTSENHVSVEIVVQEGPPTVNRRLEILGIEALPAVTQAAVRKAALLELVASKPFEEDAADKCTKSAQKALTDVGYAYAKVERDSLVDVVNHAADTTLTIVPGETARFGKITFDGLDPEGPRKQELPEAPLRRALDMQEGELFSTDKIDYATQALLDLEVFAAVKMTPDLSHPETRVVAIEIHVEPTRLKEVKLGGGLEFDELKTELHLLSGWEDHNVLGGLRDFSVTFSPGVVFYPTRVDNIVAPDHFFPEEKLRAELKQPGFIEGRTTAFVRPEYNIFPLLVELDPTTADPVVGYREFKTAVGLERTFYKKLYVNLSYQAQIETPFAYYLPLDANLQQIVILYPELLTRLDFRDDTKHPHFGFYIQNDIQIANGFLGGEAKDVKIQPEVRTYLPVGPKVTFATRASLGMIFPALSTYGGTIEDLQKTKGLIAENQTTVRDVETTLFRGFTSGGPTTNRGFPIRGIAPYGVIPFLNPTTAAQQAMFNCDPAKAKVTGMPIDPSHCGAPIGGFTLWEFSNEVRWDIKGPISVASFCDMGDVSPHEIGQSGGLRLDHLHLSCGLGGRYDTPVGPIRLDIGYRIQPLQVLGFKSEDDAHTADPTNPNPPKIFGVLPLALAIGIGEAF